MKDPVARVLAGTALAVALVALVLAGWGMHSLARRDDDLRALGARIERALVSSRPTTLGPPPTFDDADR